MTHREFEAMHTREVCMAYGAQLSTERGALARSLACLAVMIERRVHVELGFPTMRDYLMSEFHQSASAVYKRMRAAAAGRKFPLVLAAIERGELHLSAVVEIEPCLTPANVESLVRECTHRSREDVQVIVARHFPRPDVPTSVRAIAPASARVSPGTLGTLDAPSAGEPQEPVSPGTLGAREAVPVSEPMGPDSADAIATTPEPAPTRVKPLAPERFELRTTLDQETLDLLREAQALLASKVPSRDAALVLKRVLADWVGAAKRRRYAETEQPRPRTSEGNGRYVPARVKREVRERDGYRCTFVAADGRRCACREQLEYDHIVPVARGGRTCTANLRLRCRAHNQLEAERAFGNAFMQRKRETHRPPAP